MATVTYTCSFSSNTGFETSPSTSLTGPSGSIPEYAQINSVKLALYIGVEKAGTHAANITLTDSSGASLLIPGSYYHSSSSVTRADAIFGGTPSADLDWNSLNTITLSGSTSLNTRSGYTGTLTIDYTSYTQCGAPETLTLGTDAATPGAKVTLSWKGASAGENNAIAGYYIYRATEPDGDYDLYTSVASTSTEGSVTVTAPTENGASYYYKVLTVGVVSGYDSEKSVSYAELECSFDAVGAPTDLTLDITNVAPGAAATLAWSGAAAGDNNAITAYEIYRSTSAAGDYTLLDTVPSTATSGSATVTAPERNGVTYYYKVRTLGSTDAGHSALSAAYTSLTCTYSAPSAPSSVTVNGASYAYAEPGDLVTLAWSGAEGGANNDIVGYAIHRNGTEYVTGLAASATSYDVPAHDTKGVSYRYTVVTVGAHSSSSESVAVTVYAYTDPAAPTAVSVSDATPAAGRRVTLTWSGAAPGGYNDITGYRIYRATSAAGAYSLIMSVSSTEPSASCLVDAPTRAGAAYYFRVATVGAVSASEPSSVYTAITAREATDADAPQTTVTVRPPKPRKKRGLILGDYDTAARGWTLAALSFQEPEPVTNYVEVPGRSAGPLDMSTALTGGIPTFGNRTLSARLELSSGDRQSRNAERDSLVNKIHGRSVDIILPDDSTRYIIGRVMVKTEYSDLAHAAVEIEAVCAPWRYSSTEVVMELLVTETERIVALANRGSRVLVPEITVGTGSRVVLATGDLKWTLTAGTYYLPDLTLPQGNTLLTYSGVGVVGFRYREAIL